MTNDYTGASTASQSPALTHSDDARLAQLRTWVGATLKREDIVVTTASADASFRRYFRASTVAGAESWIVMDAPPEKENVEPFIHVAQMLGDAGVNAPRVLARDARGYLLLTDLGDQTYLSVLADRARADVLYADAIDALVKMQIGCAPRVQELPAYDDALLHREMQLFPEWFIARHLNLALAEDELRALQKVFATLAASALAQPRVFVHRDYHSRNLMTPQIARHGTNPGVLDFQDAVLGPITYDLVSLLRDCYIEWPQARVQDWIARYRDTAKRSRLNVGSSAEEFNRWFDLMGVQRHLKAIGIFSRLWHRDGKRGYLGDIPRTLGYVCTVVERYPELNSLQSLIDQKLLPALART